MDDEWPFVLVEPFRRPVNALDAFHGVDVNKILDAEWLRLSDYTDQLKTASTWEVRKEEADQRYGQLSNTIEEHLDDAPDHPRQRP